MSAPAELSFDEILKFMLAHNGKVTNHELVKHFKVFLMNPDMRDEARNTFKKHVNTLAIIKNQNNEKWLILKKKYLPNNSQDSQGNGEVMPESNITNSEPVSELTPAPPPYRPPPPLQLNQDFNILTNIIQDAQQPMVNSRRFDTPENESMDVTGSVSLPDIPPKVHPRRKSSVKSNSEKRTSIPDIQNSPKTLISPDETSQNNSLSSLSTSKSESMLVDGEQKISVKERKQMFNRMASEGDVIRSNKLGANQSQQNEDEDRLSLDQKENDPLDSKQKQWILNSARGEYHVLAKMCKENPKLVKTKDPFTTALHWACKRGDENLVKLLAGVARQLVNERSGYTPLHIAMQFRHENVYRLMVEVYDADPNVRDWSGRKPRQYLIPTDTSLSPGLYRKTQSLDLRRNNSSIPAIKVTHTIPTQSKKESFLRIGSLNVRVKKTTEAFSNFLGVGATRSSAYLPKMRDRDADRRSEDGDHLHKSWGSADNIQKEDKLMPPPIGGKVKRRGASGRKGLAAHSRSTPSTPDQPRAHIGSKEDGDSDSDSAAGFHAAWRQQRASCT